MANDENMIQAYREGKDLYCVIAASVFNNRYEDNLENYPEGTVVELDGKKTVAGADKTFKKQVTDKLEVPYYYLIQTNRGEIAALDIKSGDKVVAAEGLFIVGMTDTTDGLTTIYFVD